MAGYRKLNQQQDQRQATLRNLVTALLWHGRIETTLARAKEARRIAEKLITLAVREHANTVKVVKEVAEGDEKLKKEIINDAPSRLAARRRIMQYLYDIPEPRKEGETKYEYKKRTAGIKNPLVEKVFREYGPKYYKRAQELGQGGGYTRIIKKGPRRGDAAEMVILELI
ncbi:MAG: 50S ribosomal protein L17 [Christensenellaceae bacterium]|nr:50S ribosomal protein L17 [Christensenellaceae bacterium]